MLLAGLRTMTRTLHARLEVGMSVSSLETETFFPGEPPAISQTDVYPVIGLGGGLQLGRVRLHAGLQYALGSDPEREKPELPLRIMGVVGVDLWRR